MFADDGKEREERLSRPNVRGERTRDQGVCLKYNMIDRYLTCNLRVTERVARYVTRDRDDMVLRSLDFSRTLNTLDIPMRRADCAYAHTYVPRVDYVNIAMK